MAWRLITDITPAQRQAVIARHQERFPFLPGLEPLVRALTAPDRTWHLGPLSQRLIIGEGCPPLSEQRLTFYAGLWIRDGTRVPRIRVQGAEYLGWDAGEGGRRWHDGAWWVPVRLIYRLALKPCDPAQRGVDDGTL